MPPIRSFAVLVISACAWLSGCASAGVAFGPTHYEHLGFHYKIAYAGKAKELLGPDWRLDNLKFNRATNRWESKRGPEYIWTREQDLNADGTIDLGESHEEGVYDLRYQHERDRGVIWTKAHPLLRRNAAKDLDVILENYAEQLSGEGLYSAGTIFSAETVKSRRYVSFIVERTPIQIGPNLGVVGVIELAEVERLRLDPNHRSARLKIVFSKLTYQNPSLSGAVPGGQHRMVDCGTRRCEQGVALLVAGYYNDASHFAEHLGEFDDLIRRLSVPPEGVLADNFRSRPVKTVPAPEATAPPPPPPPPAAP
jgi:hypothetical protein